MVAYFPAWVQTLGSMIEHTGPTFQIKVKCEKCGGHRVLTKAALEALAEVVGRDFSLVNKRTRCRLWSKCDGWNRFFYQSGVMRPLWDDAADLRWVAAERR